MFWLKEVEVFIWKNSVDPFTKILIPFFITLTFIFRDESVRAEYRVLALGTRAAYRL